MAHPGCKCYAVSVRMLSIDILAVLSAPALDRLLVRWPQLEPALLGLVRVVVFGVIVLDVVPDGMRGVGIWALVLVAGGFAAGWAMEQSAAGRASALGVTAMVLAVHHVLDGIALGQPGEQHIGVAVIAHTLPVALLAWRLAADKAPESGWLLLCALAVATTVGFVIGGSLLPGAGSPALACVLGGWLMHALVHHAPSGHQPGGTGPGAGLPAQRTSPR